MLSGLVGLKLCFMKVSNYQSQRLQKSGFFYDRVRRGITYDLVNKFYFETEAASLSINPLHPKSDKQLISPC